MIYGSFVNASWKKSQILLWVICYFFLFLNIEVLPGQFEKKYKLHVFEVIKREIITEETKTIRLL